MDYHSTALRSIRRQMDESNRSAQTAVLQLLNTRDFTFDGVIKRLTNSKLDEASIKAAVFRLFSEGRVEINSEWRIHLAGRRQNKEGGRFSTAGNSCTE